jgi:hypothetical protein
MPSNKKWGKLKEWLSGFFSPKDEARYMLNGKCFNDHTQRN